MADLPRWAAVAAVEVLVASKAVAVMVALVKTEVGVDAEVEAGAAGAAVGAGEAVVVAGRIVMGRRTAMKVDGVVMKVDGVAMVVWVVAWAVVWAVVVAWEEVVWAAMAVWKAVVARWVVWEVARVVLCLVAVRAWVLEVVLVPVPEAVPLLRAVLLLLEGPQAVVREPEPRHLLPLKPDA